MKRKALAMLLCTAMAVSMAAGCGSSDSKSEDTAAPAETEEAADKDDAAERPVQQRLWIPQQLLWSN